MRRLYIVRHGETDANFNHIVQGQLYNNPLNETGRQQAKLTGEVLSDVDLKFIYVSPALRARQTATKIFSHQTVQKTFEREVCGLESSIPEFEIHSGLLEIHQGIFEGMKTEDIQKNHENLYWTHKNRPAEMAYPNGESIMQASNRVTQTLTAILTDHPLDNILIVGHGGTIALMFINLFQLDINKMYHSIRHENCAISIIEWPSQESRPRIVVLNDICHLKKISER